MANSSRLSPRALRPMLIVSLVGLSWWFFGNLYEAIVISPNWVVDSPAQLTRLNEFFVNTSPTLYFVPFTLLAVLLLWITLVIGRRSLPRKAVIWTALISSILMGLNALIVSVLITALFGPNYLDHGAALSAYAWWWNLANIARMALTATTIVLTWKLLSAVPARPGTDRISWCNFCSPSRPGWRHRLIPGPVLAAAPVIRVGRRWSRPER